MFGSSSRKVLSGKGPSGPSPGNDSGLPDQTSPPLVDLFLTN